MNAIALLQSVVVLATSAFVVPTISETVPLVLFEDAESAEADFQDGNELSDGQLETLEYRGPEESRAMTPVSERIEMPDRTSAATPSRLCRGRTF